MTHQEKMIKQAKQLRQGEGRIARMRELNKKLGLDTIEKRV